MEKEMIAFRQVNLAKLNTLQDVIRTAILHRQAIFPVVGDCMEGAGIADGGHVAVDFTHYPRPGRRENGIHRQGDPCMCWAQAPDSPRPSLMCKIYDGVWLGHMVGTRYRQEEGKPFRMNGGFRASLILGVIYASWDKDGKLLWECDPEIFPTKLPDRITVGNSGSIGVDDCLVPWNGGTFA